MTDLLFVYGTLKRRSRHPMARRLAERARCVGPAALAARLYNLGRFPGITPPAGPDDWVQGDLYDLGDDPQTLHEMDVYEGVESPWPAFFDRQRARVRLPAGDEVEAWVYWFRGAVEESERIATGCYEVNCDPA